MAESKYGKYLFKNPIVKGKFGPRLIFYSRQHPEVGEKNFSVLCNCVTEAHTMVQDAHAHDFDQFLHFYGANSLNITEFDAEVELSLGEEGEKHIISTPSYVIIPEGLQHGPINTRKVERPFGFYMIRLDKGDPSEVNPA